MKTRKMKTTNIFLGLTMMMFLVSFTISVSAQNGPGKGRGNGQGWGRWNTDQPGRFCMNNIPDLTEDQEVAIEELRIAHMKEMTRFRNKMAEKRAKFNTMLASEDPDDTEVNNLISDISGLKEKMMKERYSHKRAVRELLTDKQKVWFDSRQGRGRGPCGKGMGRGNGWRGDNCPYRD